MPKWDRKYEKGRKYKVEWEKNFAWVSASAEGTHKAVCRVCRRSILAKKDALIQHEKTATHKHKSCQGQDPAFTNKSPATIAVSTRCVSDSSSQPNRKMSSDVSSYQFETLKVTTPQDNVFHVELNRPEKSNAMNMVLFREITECFTKIADDSDCRVAVLSGAGKNFTGGLDLTDAAAIIAPQEGMDVGRRAADLRKHIIRLQESNNVIEKCLKPVIAAVHSACIGGGVDMITACDIRMCTKDAWFSIKEIDIGLAADLGTLQRFPKVIGNDSLVRELAYTGRALPAEESKEIGLVSRIFPDKESLMSGVFDLAKMIASKSPIAIQSTKASLVYSRDHTVDNALEHVRTLNMSMLQSEDVMKAAMASMQKADASFSKL